MAAGVALMLAASLSAAEIDFSDFDDTVMRDMDDGIKELDATVSARNGAGALSTAAALDASAPGTVVTDAGSFVPRSPIQCFIESSAKV